MSRKRHNTQTHELERIENDTPNNVQVGVDKYLRIGKEFGGIFTLFLGLAYGLGFFISNSYLLTKFGIYDFELLKARYIFVGFMFLVILYIAFIGSLMISRIWVLSQKAFLRVIFGVGLLLVWASLMGTAVKGILFWLAQEYSIVATAATVIRVWGIFAILIILAIMFLVRRGGWTELGIPFPLPYTTFTGLLAISALYGVLVYPLLPVAAGGSLPIPVRLVVDENKIEVIKQLLPVEHGLTTEKLYLVEQSSTTYYLLVNTDQGTETESFVPVELNKTLVMGIIHQDEEIPASLYSSLFGSVFRVFEGYPIP